MTKESAKQFLTDNRDALMALADLIRQAELVSDSYEEWQARKTARLIVEKWIGDIFNTTYTVDDFPNEEESIYRRSDRERQEGRPDAY